MDLAEKIKQYRRIKNLTQAELAQNIGVSPITERRWEWGERIPRADEMSKLAEALGTTVGVLMGEGEPEKTPVVEPPEEQSLMRKLLQELASLTVKDGNVNKEENNNNLKATPFPAPLKPNELGIAYWGSVVDNARRISQFGNSQDREVALMMLHMAVDAITGSEGKTTPATTSINAYNGDHSSYNGNILSTGHEN